MSKYECPNCNGGFPEPGQEKECPWCGTKLDKSYGNRSVEPSNATLERDAFAAGQLTQDTGYTVEPADVKFTERNDE